MKLSYGARGEELLHVSQVSSGIMCDCVCISCKQPLVAKKGRLKIHHFSHHNSEECSGAIQTMVHRLAKEILSRRKLLRLPAVYYQPGVEGLMALEKDIQFQRVTIEQKITDVIPDLIGHSRGRPLIIEVCVTHPVDESKIQRIANLGISALEIVISPESDVVEINELENAIVFSGHRRWLWNVKAQERRERELPSMYPKSAIHRFFAYFRNYYAYFPLSSATALPTDGQRKECLEPLLISKQRGLRRDQSY